LAFGETILAGEPPKSLCRPAAGHMRRDDDFEDESPPDEPGFVRPEDAALAGYSAGARARVVRVRLVDPTNARVVIDTEPSHPVTVYCRRFGNLWYDWGYGSGED